MGSVQHRRGIRSEYVSKTLDRLIKKDKRVEEWEGEQAGFFGYKLHLSAGWCNGRDHRGDHSEDDCLHSVKGDTVREAVSEISNVIPCDCQRCAGEGGN